MVGVNIVQLVPVNAPLVFVAMAVITGHQAIFAMIGTLQNMVVLMGLAAIVMFIIDAKSNTVLEALLLALVPYPDGAVG